MGSSRRIRPELTLPLAGKHGTAAIVDPAAASPPWLSTDGSGGLAFLAPVDTFKQATDATPSARR